MIIFYSFTALNRKTCLIQKFHQLHDNSDNCCFIIICLTIKRTTASNTLLRKWLHFYKTVHHSKLFYENSITNRHYHSPIQFSLFTLFYYELNSHNDLAHLTGKIGATFAEAKRRAGFAGSGVAYCYMTSFYRERTLTYRPTLSV